MLFVHQTTQTEWLSSQLNPPLLVHFMGAIQAFLLSDKVLGVQTSIRLGLLVENRHTNLADSSPCGPQTSQVNQSNQCNQRHKHMIQLKTFEEDGRLLTPDGEGEVHGGVVRVQDVVRRDDDKTLEPREPEERHHWASAWGRDLL